MGYSFPVVNEMVAGIGDGCNQRRNNQSDCRPLAGVAGGDFVGFGSNGPSVIVDGAKESH
jgi:hypothetical protein